MKRRMTSTVSMVVLAIALVAGVVGVSYGVSSYRSAFATYLGTLGIATTSPLNTCALCHPAGGGNDAGNLNGYADDYAGHGNSYTAIEQLDSDGDGYKNIDEIRAGTFPGDATSHPTSVSDSTAPTVSAFTVPATSTSLTVSITSFTATDNVGVTGYMVTVSSTAPLASASGWLASAPTAYTAATAGAKTLYAWAKDAAGNVSAPKSAAVTITLPDSTAPTVSAFTVPATSTSLTVSVTSFTATDNVGVTGYMVTSTSTTPSASDINWSPTRQANYTFTTAGAKTLYAWAKDAAGNVSAPKSAAVTITLPDGTAPTVSAFTVPATSTSLTVSVTSFTATDNVGVTGYMVTSTSTTPSASDINWSPTRQANYTFTTAGAKTLYAWAKDAAGNVSAPKSAAVTITLPDGTAPTVSAFTVPATSASLTVSVTSFTATDNVGVTGYMVTASSTIPAASATDWTSAAPTSYTFTTAGAKTLYAWAKDAAGNISVPLSAAVTITLPDSTAPIVAAFTIPSSSNSLTVTVNSFTATDNVGVTGYMVTESSTAPLPPASGWSSTPPTSYTFSSAGTKRLYAWAKDAAGHVSTPRSAAVTITLLDIIPPSIVTFLIPPASNSLTVTVNNFTATDNVGVTGYMVTESSTAPLPPASGWSSTPPTSYTFSSAGTKRLYAWAKDAAGNISTAASGTVVTTLVAVSDTTPPTITTFAVPWISTSLTVAVTLEAVDNMGVTAYLVSESSVKPNADSPAWQADAPTSYTFKSAGYLTKTLYAWAKDAAGNISARARRSVIVRLSSH